jgi:hypothetical protein
LNIEVSVGEIKVSIYERVKLDGKWTRVRVEVPNGRRRDGRLLLKDDRQGKFELSWYEKRIKQWQRVTNPNDEEQLPLLSHALKQADDKSWFLNNRHRNVTDPTATTASRKKLADEITSSSMPRAAARRRSPHIGFRLPNFRHGQSNRRKVVAFSSWMRSQNQS